MANVTGNPKRTIGTILTIGLSCVLFVIISNYVGNIDTEYEAYPENNLDSILKKNPLNETLINGTEEFQYSGNIAGAFVSADTYWVMPEEVYEIISR